MARSENTKAFEAKKIRLASLYTVLICGGLMALLLISWTLPATPVPPAEEGLEVNLGNSDQGKGTDQPFLPGESSSKNQEKFTPPKAVAAEKEALKSVETDDKDADETTPVVKQPPVTKPEATKIPDRDLALKKPNPKAPPVADPVPTPPRPKAVYGGNSGTGNGGNDADHYKPGGSEGIAGGKGDQGAPGGDPNSKNYKGGGTGSGVAISRGLQGRSIRTLPSFTDEFNDNAKVAVDIHVDGDGNVTDASYQPRGSTTADASMKAIAIRKAKEIRFTSGEAESAGTLIFNFKLKN